MGEKPQAGACPVMSGEQPHPLAGGCPVKHDQSGCADVNPLNNMLLEERQKAAPGQERPLSTSRITSSIPKGDFQPDHQSASSEKWEYPSPQMFYNAMLRKGWKPAAGDMDTIVSIHNAVNESGWRQVQAWESLHPETASGVKLKKFIGRPTDYTPKARLRSLFGAALPFDRHDWIVDRNGKEVRYVLDFYSISTDGLPRVDIDVRPAVDSVGSFVDRIRMNFRKIFS